MIAGMDGLDDLDPQMAWLVRELRAHMRKRPKREQLSDAALHAHALYETNVHNLPSGHLACKAGCGSCCCAQVGVEMAEAFAIVRHVREVNFPHDAEQVLARVADVANRIAGLDEGTRWEAQIPCAFLDAHSQSCTIYPVRPLACRGYTSTDLAACEASTQKLDHGHPIPGDGERMVRSRQLRTALGLATARALEWPHAPDSVELHAAVIEAAEAGEELIWVRRNRKG